MSPLSDSDANLAAVSLMRRVAARDAAAQRQLASRVVQRVQRLCRLVLRNAADADDASQQALIEILNSAHTFHAPGNLDAWADKITVRTAFRARKEKARSSLISQTLSSMTGSWFPRATAAREAPRELEDYLNELSDVRRDAFVLKHALGYTVEEIGDLTGAPPGTVKDRLVAAKRQLRDLYERDAGEQHHDS